MSNTNTSIKKKCTWADIEEDLIDCFTVFRCTNCGHGQMEYQSDVTQHVKESNANHE